MTNEIITYMIGRRDADGEFLCSGEFWDRDQAYRAWADKKKTVNVNEHIELVMCVKAFKTLETHFRTVNRVNQP